MTKHRSILIGDGGSNPTPPLHIGKAWQRIIREKYADSQIATSSYSLKDAVVKEIKYAIAKPLILKYEWLQSMPHRFAFRVAHGLYCGNDLIGALVYAQPAQRSKSLFGEDFGGRSIIQLSRGACTPESPFNSASFLISKSLLILKKEGIKAVVAYCTPEAGEVGTIYQACNFMFIGYTKPSKEFFIDNRWCGERSMAHKWKWLKEQEPSVQEEYRKKFESLPSRICLPRLKYLYVLDEKLRDRIKPLKYVKRSVS